MLPADLIVYGLIAAGLIFWLRSILGTRGEDEKQRPLPPFLSGLEPANDTAANAAGVRGDMNNAESLIAALVQSPKGSMSIEGRTAELGLIEIARTDKAFDIYAFLQAAQDAFVFIVESFADSDRATLKDLLAPQVFDAFDRAITARQNAGETLKTEIHAIRKSEVIGARVEGRLGMVTVRFVADETSFTKNASGEILHGHPEKTTQMRDVWTFARDLKSRDPRWLLVETREDSHGDNLTIPNTHMGQD